MNVAQCLTVAKNTERHSLLPSVDQVALAMLLLPPSERMDDNSRSSHEAVPRSVGSVNAKNGAAKEVGHGGEARTEKPPNAAADPPVACGYCRDPIHEPDGVPMHDVRVHQRCARAYRSTMRTKQ